MLDSYLIYVCSNMLVADKKKKSGNRSEISVTMILRDLTLDEWWMGHQTLSFVLMCLRKIHSHIREKEGKTKSEEERISGKARGEENMKNVLRIITTKRFLTRSLEEKRKHGKAFCATRKHFKVKIICCAYVSKCK